MPIGAMGIALLASSAASGAATAYGAHKQASASKKAGDQQQQGLREQLAFERENEARRRQEYDRAEAMAQQQWEAEQARRAPFREAADAIIRKRMGGMGMPVSSPMPQMPARGGSPMTGGGSMPPGHFSLQGGTLGNIGMGQQSQQPQEFPPPLPQPQQMSLGQIADWAPSRQARY